MITIHVLHVPEVLPEAYWNHFLSKVSAERRAQASRFVRQADAYRSVLGEILSRVTLSKLTGLRPADLSLPVIPTANLRSVTIRMCHSTSPTLVIGLL